jgi:hypothetical protein
MLAWWALRPEPPDIKRIAEAPALEARGARSIIVREGGQKAWEFSAQRITVAPNRILATIENISQGTIFQKGQPLWRLRAARVEANQLTRDIQAHAAVATLQTQNLRISAPLLLWKHHQKTLHCPQDARANMKNQEDNPRAATNDVGRGELRCTAGVEVTSRFGTLRAPAAIAYPKDRRVEFRGGVDIVMRRSALPLPG